jgi:hypothetical protein
MTDAESPTNNNKIIIIIIIITTTTITIRSEEQWRMELETLTSFQLIIVISK